MNAALNFGECGGVEKIEGQEEHLPALLEYILGMEWKKSKRLRDSIYAIPRFFL
jgi:hypothetical protein